MIHEEKSRLRKKIILERRRLSPIQRMEQTKKVAEKFAALTEYISAKTIGFYASKAEELSTDRVICRALEDKKRVFLPRVMGEDLIWGEIKNLDELEVGEFAIREPRRDSHQIEMSQIDLLVVPGVAFDKRGNRLGYGRGFFDKVLAVFRGFSVGLAFDCQIVDEVPVEKWDERVKKVLVGK